MRRFHSLRDESPSAKRWLPLEAHPDLMNQFVWGEGLPVDEAEFYDVYGFDDELLEMVPKSVLAVIFLFPITSEVPVPNSFCVTCLLRGIKMKVFQTLLSSPVMVQSALTRLRGGLVGLFPKSPWAPSLSTEKLRHLRE